MKENMSVLYSDHQVTFLGKSPKYKIVCRERKSTHFETERLN